MNFIFDRTVGDVYEAIRLNNLKWSNMTPQEQESYLNGLKGSYTINDFNRVSSIVEELVDLLLSIGIRVTVNIREWKHEDIPDDNKTQEYLDNIRTLREAFRVLPTTPDVPDNMEHFNFESANNIEQILFDLHLLIDSTKRNKDLSWCLGIAHTGIYVG